MSKRDVRTSDRANDRRPDPERGAAPESRQAPFETRLQTCLRAGDIAAARSLVAEVEGAVAASRSVIAAAKARIALSTGDEGAARAILVMAIEADPGAAALRARLTEVMLAGGRAADVRPVLHHLGRPPSDPDRDATEPDLSADVAT